MDEIKVGEYIRLDDGTIGKYQINKNWLNVVETNDKYIGFDIEYDIVNHSKNIKDLVEENDYVNGNKVVSINGELYVRDEGVLSAIEVKSIVTHENFKEMEYRV